MQITNVGQHGRKLLQKLGYEHTKLYVFNGVSWTISFFVVRILPRYAAAVARVGARAWLILN